MEVKFFQVFMYIHDHASAFVFSNILGFNTIAVKHVLSHIKFPFIVFWLYFAYCDDIWLMFGHPNSMVQFYRLIFGEHISIGTPQVYFFFWFVALFFTFIIFRVPGRPRTRCKKITVFRIICLSQHCLLLECLVLLTVIF